MEGLLDFVLRDILTRVGGVDRCVSEFIRVSDTLLPERVFTRVVPELLNGGRTFAGVPVRPQLLGSDPVCLAENAARAASISPTTPPAAGPSDSSGSSRCPCIRRSSAPIGCRPRSVFR